MEKLLTLICLLLLSGIVNAGEATGRVTSIYVADDSSSILFRLDSSIKNTPKCNESARFSLSLRKKGGMAAYMALLEAKREKYSVTVEGLNTCANHWKSEDILDIHIE